MLAGLKEFATRLLGLFVLSFLALFVVIVLASAGVVMVFSGVKRTGDYLDFVKSKLKL